LIQQNLVYHFLDPADHRTYYEGNTADAYALVRSGKIVELVQSRYGVLAKDVIQNLLLLGHTKVSDLAEQYETAHKALHANDDSNGHSGVNGTNGQAKTHITSAGQLDSILCALLQSALIEPVIERMFRSPTDTYTQVEKEILEQTFSGSTTGSKQKDELKVKVRHRLKSLRDEGLDWRPKGNKRPLPSDLANGAKGHDKKRRLSKGEAGVDGDQVAVFEDEGIRLDVGFLTFWSRIEC